MSAPARNVELSLFPDIQPDKPTGTILPSVFQGNNSELMAAVAPFYLRGSVMDATYGDGNWWNRYRPDPLVAHDKFKGDGVDFTDLPEVDNTYDAVTFDPPYIPAGGYETSTLREFHDGFGLRQHTRDDLAEMNARGLSECARVTRPGGYILAKCTDYVSSAKFWLGHVEMIEAGQRHGLAVHDLIVHFTGPGPGGWNIFTPIRARRAHSYLLVFAKAAS